MPHIKLEYSKKLTNNEIKTIFKLIIDIIVKYANVKKNNCKCKGVIIPIYYLENLNNFYHLEIVLLKGRTNKIKKYIGEKCLETLKKYFDKEKNSYSIEIREMDNINYYTNSKF